MESSKASVTAQIYRLRKDINIALKTAGVTTNLTILNLLRTSQIRWIKQLNLGLWGNDASDLAFASLLDKCGLSGSATTGESGFALATKGVESKLCDEGTSERTDFDGKRVCFTVAVGSHVFNSVDLILWFSTGFSWVPTKGGCAHSWEFDANHMQKEACMLIQLTSLHVAWAAFDVNPRWSNVVTMFLAQYPLAPTSMAKELTIHPRFLMESQRVAYFSDN